MQTVNVGAVSLLLALRSGVNMQRDTCVERDVHGASGRAEACRQTRGYQGGQIKEERREGGGLWS